MTSGVGPVAETSPDVGGAAPTCMDMIYKRRNWNSNQRRWLRSVMVITSDSDLVEHFPVI